VLVKERMILLPRRKRTIQAIDMQFAIRCPGNGSHAQSQARKQLHPFKERHHIANHERDAVSIARRPNC